ncbi:PREDICTED: uncharacterized protein LOC106742878 [Dinoponera quadriceps]|uniref:Uncharacterized protein LOC106742878 n=1 Tax=Dinoponera quadriceps TaxID=609295 RepID=A0A6P3X026_DINQU|nr:PREDICTED: uncharacterized protein LOC106742878 [Dinoponera quadriceps]XP_014471710.1 PREDICTED: uncharacterized protein LOC106742878 [Dinoponera quadriceps]XP_014471711.1 PREDICTED: uncharacterized protein LOC106742878 [Dinoponera quadriceps]
MHCVTMDSYPTPNFDSCMIAAANQQRDVSQPANSQPPAVEQAQTQEEDQQQQMEQTQQITQQVQPNTQQSPQALTPIRLPAILDGEYFTVTKVEDSNVTVRCSQCQRHLNGNLKSTGNFLSHIKRVHPLLIDRIKCKSNQRKPAMVYVDSSSSDKCSDTTRIKRYKYHKNEDSVTKEESFEHEWSNTPFSIRSRRPVDEPETDQLRVTSHNSCAGEDEYDAIGRNVAAKLRHMRIDQRIIAEKLVNDILFEAQLGNLSRDSNLHV